MAHTWNLVVKLSCNFAGFLPLVEFDVVPLEFDALSVAEEVSYPQYRLIPQCLICADYWIIYRLFCRLLAETLLSADWPRGRNLLVG